MNLSAQSPPTILSRGIREENGARERVDKTQFRLWKKRSHRSNDKTVPSSHGKNGATLRQAVSLENGNSDIIEKIVHVGRQSSSS
jgi:hypothetical protein